MAICKSFHTSTTRGIWDHLCSLTTELGIVFHVVFRYPDFKFNLFMVIRDHVVQTCSRAIVKSFSVEMAIYFL